MERFPALRLAREVLAAGGSAGTVLNAANEVAVEAFLAGRIGFLAIADLVEATLAGKRRSDRAAAPQRRGRARHRCRSEGIGPLAPGAVCISR